ncbi:MAG: PQQ-binding-like beta-propeller repeat protein [Planctomycetaceae bacterium]|nr:PQQ-binding-like beta-propeller repeat protein [Planctomycetaceae bacterium]
MPTNQEWRNPQSNRSCSMARRSDPYNEMTHNDTTDTMSGCRFLLLVSVVSSWFLAFGLVEFTIAGENWPQFRGPSGQGFVSSDVQLPVEWSESKNVVWKREITGLGHSSPVVWDGQIWVTTAAVDGSVLGAVGLDAATGDVLHEVFLFRPTKVDGIHHDNSYASPTPVIEAGRLYCHYGRYGTACVDTRTGDTLWTNDELVVDHQGGPGSSPVPYEDLIIINCDGAEAQYTAALEKESGRIRWKRLRSAPYRDDPTTHRAFSTSLVIETEAGPQVISPAADQLHAYDPRTGDELWHVRYTGFSTVPAPAYANGLVVFCTGYFEPQVWGVRTDGRGDVTESHVAWKFRGATPDTPSPTVLDGKVYLVSDSGVGTVLDLATGDSVTKFRLGGNFSASPLVAGNRLYFCDEEGRTKIVEASTKPRVIATNRLDGSLKASPAASGHAIILRTDTAVYRIEDGTAAAIVDP